jgi:peroxiredoxin Q/BCP
MKATLVGQKAPNFVLEDDQGTSFDSTSLNGTWRIVFFYSRHNSPTCKRGCLTFKEQHDLFASAGCSIVGIGPGSVEGLASFKAGLGDLPFPLLADPEREVGKRFNVPLHVGQFPAKSSFLIGPDDTIHYVYDWLFRPRRHVAKILADISKVTGDA